MKNTRKQPIADLVSPTVRNRLLMATVVILGLSFIGVGLFNYLLAKQVVHQQILMDDLPLTRDNIYSDLKDELIRPLLVASSMATDTFLKEWATDGEKDISRITRYLRAIHERYGFFSTFFVSARTGNYYHFRGLYKRISRADSHDIWFYRFIDSGRPYDLEVDTDEVSGNTLTVFINYRLVDPKGKLLGVTGVGLKIDSLAGTIIRYEKKYHRSIYLVNTDGTIQIHQNRKYINRVSITALEGIGSLADQILRVGELPQNFSFMRGGEQILLTVRLFKPLNWLLCVEQSETRTLGAARRAMLRIIVVGGVATVFVLLLTLVTINRYRKRLEILVFSDSLTGAVNRRMLGIEFSRFLSRYQRLGQRFSVILIDIDRFKLINDRYGHLVGDAILKQVTALIHQIIRPSDVLARWGGDEFVILVEANVDEATLMAERLRKKIREIKPGDVNLANQDGHFLVTVSCGVAGYNQGEDLDKVIQRADTALYRCKEKGRDMVCGDR